MGFISYEYANNVLEEEQFDSLNIDVEKFEETTIEDPYFASILNVNRELQIADTIHSIQQNMAFSYIKGHEDEIEKFIASGIEIATGDSLRVNEFLLIEGLTNDDIELENGRRAVWIFGKGWRRQTKKRDHGKNRIRARHWQTDLRWFKSKGIKTEYQRKKKGLFKRWKDKKANWILLSFNGTLRVEQTYISAQRGPNGIYYAPGYKVYYDQNVNERILRRNSGQASYTINWEAGVGISNQGGFPGTSGSGFKIKVKSLTSHHTCQPTSSDAAIPIQPDLIWGNWN